MLMCKGENTFLKVNNLGVNEVLMVYLFSITLIPYLTKRKEKKEVPSLM